MWRFVWFVFLIPILGLGCESTPPAQVGFQIGNRAPDFEGQDLEGKTIRLRDFRGKVVLVDFWATWCVPCLVAIQDEKRLINQHKGRSFAVLSISQDRKVEDLRDFLKDSPLPWPNIYDAGFKITRQWQIESLPTFILIDDEGIIRGKYVGAQDQDKIERKISDLLRHIELR